MTDQTKAPPVTAPTRGTRYRVNRPNGIADLVASFSWMAMVSLLVTTTNRWHSDAVLLALPITGFALAAFLVARQRFAALEVWADAIVLDWMGWRRTVPLAAIRSVQLLTRQSGTPPPYPVELTLESGKKLHFKVKRHWRDDADSLVVQQIHAAMGRTRSAATRVDTARLARGPREVKDWIAALRSVGAGTDSTLRVAPLSKKQLMRVVEDPGQDAAIRVAAAVAVGVELNADERGHLRRVARGTAEPRVRVAIDCVTEGGGEDELEAAMKEVVAKEQGR